MTSPSVYNFHLKATLPLHRGNSFALTMCFSMPDHRANSLLKTALADQSCGRMALPLSTICGALKRGAHGTEQGLLAKGLGQEVHRASLQRSLSHVFIVMRRDEDDRDTAISRSQLTLQLEAVHPWHPHIENQAGRVV